jgi:crossover junction endodeoxyribonuclease RuvC
MPAGLRILGLDPGLRLTGYGVVEYHAVKPILVDGGVIRLDATAPVASRLVELERELDSLLAEHKPDVVAVETLYAHYAHPRTAILMAHARGVILLTAARKGIRLEQYPANRVKQAVSGHGHASKHQMQRAIQNVWKLKEPPDPPDVADALAIALCCGMELGMASVAGTNAT